MRVLAPTLSLEPRRAVVAATFESGSGAVPRTTVRLAAPRELVGRLDVSATPFLPIAAVAAAALGEDVELETGASPATQRGAGSITTTMARWWSHDGWRSPRITGPAGEEAAADPGRGHGLCFSLGVDSWASLVTLRDQPDPSSPALSHLLLIDGFDRPRPPEAQATVTATARRVAAELDLSLVELWTDARDLLDPIAVWDRTHGAVLAALGLLLGPALAIVTIAGSHSDGHRPPWGSHVELDHHWSSGTTRIDHHLGHLDRTDKVARIADTPLALATLLTCWEGGAATNCGRCPKCLRTMTALQLAGALDRCPMFPSVLDPAAIRATAHADSPEFVDELLARLPPGPIRAAWASHRAPRRGLRRLVRPGLPALAGPPLADRLDDALATTGWRLAGGPADDPAGGSADPLVVGWEPAMVPLRPARAAQAAIRRAVAGHVHRPLTWVVADLGDPLQVNDPATAALADHLEQAWGPGIAYLAGIGWADEPQPVLGPDAVGRLLGAARIRLWAQADGPLDPLRTVESIEHGCLPLQVMPAAAAARLGHRLAPALAALVVTEADLAAMPHSPEATADRLRAAAEVVLAGSAERDLALDAAFHVPAGAAGG